MIKKKDKDNRRIRAQTRIVNNNNNNEIIRI